MQPEPASQPVGSGVFSPERRRLTLGILLCVAAFAVEGMGVTPALPTAVRSLGGLPLFGWVFSAFMLAWIVGTIAAGQLADRRGPLLPMGLGLGGFGVGLLLSGSASGMGLFLGGRVLQGMGGGSLIAAAYVTIARGYPENIQARMMASISSVWILPAMCGPTISGMVAERTSWRLVFFAVLPVLLLAAALVLPPLRRLSLDHPSSPRGPSRAPLAVQLAIGAALVLAAPSLRPHGLPVALLSGAVGLLLLFPALRRLLPVGTLSGQPGLPMGLLARGILAFSFFGAEAFVPLGAGELRGATPTQAGLALTTGALGWIAAAWFQDRIESRGAIRAAARVRRIGAGFLLLAVGIAAMTVALLTDLPFLLLPLGWAIAGAGIGCAFSTGTLLCLSLAPPGREGEVSSQLQLTEALGTALGTGAGGTLLALSRPLGISAADAHLSIFAATTVVALCGALLTPRLLGQSAPTADPAPR